MQSTIEGFDGKYSIDSRGFIINNNTGRTIYGTPDKNGYIKVRLYRTAKDYIDTYMQKLVAVAFVDIPKRYDPDSFESLSVIHKDGDKSNNDSSNLDWMMFSETITNGRERGSYDMADSSKRHPVIGIKLSTMKPTVFDSITSAASYVKLESSSTASLKSMVTGIRAALNNITHKAYGYMWKYK